MTRFARTVLAVLLVLSGGALAQGVAFITNVRGDVVVDGSARPLVLAELARGQKIALGNDALASVMFSATGREYTLRGPGRYEVGDGQIATLDGPPAATRSTEWRANDKVLAQVAKTSSASVRMRSVAKPRAEPAPRLLFPTQGSVGTLQPTFRWAAADAAAPSEFTLLVPGQEKPVHRAKAAGGSYRVPVKLKPDTEYAWVVSTGGDELGTGRFRTLSADALKVVEKRRPGDKAEFSDRVLFALLLQEMGAVQEARETWARLAEERADLPELSGLAR